MSLRSALSLALVSFALLLFPHRACAQDDDHSLTQGEIEELRDAAYYPQQRVELFIKLLDQRVKAIQDLYAHPRKPGREDDTHDLLNQFNSIANELEDNLDDYSNDHRDIRKALPKLLEATERWSSAIKSPPDDETYNVSRKLALETIRDVHDDATGLVESQKTWFKDHPPPKANKTGEIDIPR
ncbi:hypothetical protein GCM10011507_10270 [Edaphobacter acidisoli]|uniref:Uncharacterized protein n=1 Tax=Edaphobacter acidisoli TaxID=2040573 RepID=A0A916RNT2_9BACT|nr:hypothetical protein [Edaphobacter acidisoli]GGA60670.1 hypothetical protein GCM10011507_10270 [Edaphobacter acidisoli]